MWGRRGTDRAGVAGEVVGFLQLGEDDDGLSGSLEAGAEGGVSDDSGGECAAEAASDEQVGGGLDGVFSGFVE